MKRLYILFLVLSMVASVAMAQIKIGDNPQTIDPSSLLELESNSRVFVISKVTTAQMETIAPQQGGMVYNTDTECIHYYDGAQWLNLCDAVSFTLTNDPIENLRSTIAITQTQGNYNLEVATNSIRTEQIADGGINGVDIQDNSIGRNKLGDAAVGPDELATESVDSDAIIDGTILPRDIGSSVPNHVLATDINGTVLWQDQNDLYELSFDKDTNTLSIVPATGLGSNSINLEALVGSDDQQLTLQGNILTLENGGTPINLNGFVNTDEQQISINPEGTRITLTNGGFVDLPSGTVDTDEQDLSLDGTTINITDGEGVDLEPLIETVVGDNGYLTVEIDGDTTNELQDLIFNPATNILTLSTPGTPGNQADLRSLAVGIGGNNSVVEIANDSLVVQDAGGRLGLLLSELGGANTLMEVTTDSLIVQDGNGRVGIPVGQIPGNGSNNSVVEIANDSLVVQDAGGRLGLLLSELGGANTLMEVTTDSLIVQDGNGRIGIPLDQIPNLATRDLTQITGENRTYNLNGQNLYFAGTGLIGIGTDNPQAKFHVSRGQVRAATFSAGDGFGYGFSSDTDTGMYRAEADQIAFDVGGNTALVIDEPRTDVTNVKVTGSFSTNIRSELGTDTISITDNDYTVIITAATAVDIPGATNNGLGVNTGKIYILKNLTGGTIPTNVIFFDSLGTSVNTLQPGVTQLQSDGINWHQIN